MVTHASKSTGEKPYTMRGILRRRMQALRIRLGPYMVGGPGAPSLTPVIPVSEFYHMYILSYQHGSCPVLPESVLRLSTSSTKCFNGRRTIPIDRAMAPVCSKVFQ